MYLCQTEIWNQPGQACLLCFAVGWVWGFVDCSPVCAGTLVGVWPPSVLQCVLLFAPSSVSAPPLNAAKFSCWLSAITLWTKKWLQYSVTQCSSGDVEKLKSKEHWAWNSNAKRMHMTLSTWHVLSCIVTCTYSTDHASRRSTQHAEHFPYNTQVWGLLACPQSSLPCLHTLWHCHFYTLFACFLASPSLHHFTF